MNLRPAALSMIAACALAAPSDAEQANDPLTLINAPPFEMRSQGEAVIVAVVDSGVDWFHAAGPRDRLWRNPGEIAGDGVDNDRNGHVDDVIGWNVMGPDNRPWDYLGHGTFVASLIAGGREPLAPAARIMVVKALGDFGDADHSGLAAGVRYAADNGARVINLSLGGDGSTPEVAEAISYAARLDALVVIAAGNTAAPIAPGFGPAGHPDAITVGAVNASGRLAGYSSWGRGVDLVAPGETIVSARARGTDFLRRFALRERAAYASGSAVRGSEGRFYEASGTSFAAPFVTAAAATLRSQRPELSAGEVKRMLVQSARDIQFPGVDEFSGYGLIDLAAALDAHPDFFLDARINRISVTGSGRQQAARSIKP
ncbi:MAG: S8 family serine peptidase [Pseudomonadota bacterium]